MSYTLVVTFNARRDIQDAIDWENMRSEGLASRFLHYLEQKLSVISDGPYIFRKRYENVHCVVTEAFSYLIHYPIDDVNHKVIVLRVLHTSRKPIW